MMECIAGARAISAERRKLTCSSARFTRSGPHDRVARIRDGLPHIAGPSSEAAVARLACLREKAAVTEANVSHGD
jgi:hypothetical protein